MNQDSWMLIPEWSSGRATISRRAAAARLPARLAHRNSMQTISSARQMKEIRIFVFIYSWGVDSRKYDFKVTMILIMNKFNKMSYHQAHLYPVMPKGYWAVGTLGDKLISTMQRHRLSGINVNDNVTIMLRPKGTERSKPKIYNICNRNKKPTHQYYRNV